MEVRQPCEDCGRDVAPAREHEDGKLVIADGTWEWYMVEDEVWVAAGMPMDPEVRHSGEGHLCIGCLERRLGRQLTAADFTDAPVNDPGPLATPRLLARLIPISEED